MSTTPSESSLVTTPTPTLPPFELSEESLYCPVEWTTNKYVISKRYQNLKKEMQEAVVALWERDYLAAAEDLANCGRYGSVYKKCKKGKRARAHRHTCHMWICHYCGKAHNLLHCYLRTRNRELRDTSQLGVEVTGPKGADVDKVALNLAGRLLRRFSVSTVRRPVVDLKAKDSRVRMVLSSARFSYDDLRGMLHEFAGSEYHLQIKRDDNPLLVLRWMFESTSSVMELCGHLRAKLLIDWRKNHMIKSTGKFYSPSPELQSATEDDPRTELDTEEFSEVEDAQDSGNEDNRCNCGHCDGIMISIPWNERASESVERIEDTYEIVDWTSCYDPFTAPRKVMTKSNLSHNYVPTMETNSPTCQGSG